MNKYQNKVIIKRDFTIRALAYSAFPCQFYLVGRIHEQTRTVFPVWKLPWPALKPGSLSRKNSRSVRGFRDDPHSNMWRQVKSCMDTIPCYSKPATASENTCIAEIEACYTFQPYCIPYSITTFCELSQSFTLPFRIKETRAEMKNRLLVRHNRLDFLLIKKL